MGSGGASLRERNPPPLPRLPVPARPLLAAPRHCHQGEALPRPALPGLLVLGGASRLGRGLSISGAWSVNVLACLGRGLTYSEGVAWTKGVAGRSSAHQVEGEPVHEQRLRAGHRHGQVHAQLVPRAAHRDAFGRRLRQDLQAQRPDLRGGGSWGGSASQRGAWRTQHLGPYSVHLGTLQPPSTGAWAQAGGFLQGLGYPPIPNRPRACPSQDRGGGDCPFLCCSRRPCPRGAGGSGQMTVSFGLGGGACLLPLHSLD